MLTQTTRSGSLCRLLLTGTAPSAPSRQGAGTAPSSRSQAPLSHGSASPAPTTRTWIRTRATTLPPASSRNLAARESLKSTTRPLPPVHGSVQRTTTATPLSMNACHPRQLRTGSAWRSKHVPLESMSRTKTPKRKTNNVRAPL